jgi:hypothetical protein
MAIKEAPCPDCGSTDHRSCRTVPVIVTEHGFVTEWARRQAALNYRRDPAKLAEGIRRFGEARLRRDFPEAFTKDEEETTQ